MFKSTEINIKEENILTAKRIGKPKTGKIQQILIKLSEPRLKRLIFPAAWELHNKFKIYVSNDYTPPQREELFNVRETKRLLRANGFECTVKGFDIIIGGKPQNWQAARTLYENWITRKLNSRKQLLDEEGMSDSSNRSNASTKRKQQDLSPKTATQRTRKKKKTKDLKIKK